MRIFHALLAGALPVFSLVALLAAAEPAPPARGTASPLADEAISEREVEREVKRVLGQRAADAAARAALAAQVRSHLADQRLVLQHLQATNFLASDDDVNLELARLKKQLAEQQLTLATFLKQNDLTEAEWRQTLLWQLSWRNYLKRYLTEESLQKYFESHAREFDGTQLKVAHLLLKLPEPRTAEAQAAALAQAESIRREIVAGQLTFAAAAARYSAAPTAGQGGDIGYISRHEPMPEAFSAAAFALAPGQVSAPVVTTAGVHLIACLEVKPGSKIWSDVREPLTAAVEQYLFRWCAENQRQHAAPK